ncbi:MAG TPA: RDD family protein [Opitutaceae bacterium]|nr:RDD family protein [Opitutaceae bacterium]
MFTIIGGDGREYGPASASQIRAWITAGRANLDTKARALGSEEWQRLGDFPEFSAPTDVPPPIQSSESPLAERGARLGAWFFDNVLAFLCILPGLVMVGFAVVRSLLSGEGNLNDLVTASNTPGWLVISAGGLLLLVVQAWLLTTRGQTVGKLLLGIRIVRALDEGNPGFGRAVALRWFVPGLITTILNIIPLLGFVFFVVDSCYIFRADRRCIHDLIAGTKVVKA